MAEPTGSPHQYDPPLYREDDAELDDANHLESLKGYRPDGSMPGANEYDDLEERGVQKVAGPDSDDPLDASPGPVIDAEQEDGLDPVAIIEQCADQDASVEVDSWDGENERDIMVAWRTEAADGCNLAVVAAIDRLGLEDAAQVYRRRREALGGVGARGPLAGQP